MLYYKNLNVYVNFITFHIKGIISYFKLHGCNICIEVQSEIFMKQEYKTEINLFYLCK